MSDLHRWVWLVQVNRLTSKKPISLRVLDTRKYSQRLEREKGAFRTDLKELGTALRVPLGIRKRGSWRTWKEEVLGPH